MSPRRPIWLNSEDCIDRGMLFGGLRGFLTYGSPLNKFAGLWPKIVPENQDRDPFRKGFQWIHVFHQTDTIAGRVDEFERDESIAKEFRPRDLRYSAYSLLLLSHLRYLTPKRKSETSLVKRVADWIISGDSFVAPVGAEFVGDKTRRLTLRLVSTYFQWAALALVLAAAAHHLTLGLLVRSSPWVSSGVSGLIEVVAERLHLHADQIPTLAPILTLAFAATLAFGLIHRVITHPRRRE